jgi:hypothetical protein
MTAFSSILLLASLAVMAAAGSSPAKAPKRRPGGYVDPQRDQRVPRAFYTAGWAVEITAGGKKMADLVARRNGFENLGEIDGLGNIYRFDLRGRERQNVHRYSPYAAKTVRLSSEPSVSTICTSPFVGFHESSACVYIGRIC